MENDTNLIKYIGVNYPNKDKRIDNILSSYHMDFRDNDLVNLGTLENPRFCTIGNVTKAYEYLRDEISSKGPANLFDYVECAFGVIMRYFGNLYYISKRDAYFPTEKMVQKKGKSRGKVSDLYQKNMAMSIERSMLLQDLFIGGLGFDSTFKISETIINDKKCIHAYNLLGHDDKYYIIDATFPSIVNNKINPIICEIPKEVYDKISSPLSDVGYSVKASYINPLENKEYCIIYDSGREKEYQAFKSYTKKKALNG